MATSNTRWIFFLLMLIFKAADNSTYEVSAKECPFDEFQCRDGSGNCITGSWRCDGEDDCSDGSDEKDCFSNHQSDTRCPFGKFMCQDGSGRCIRRRWKCDGKYDCKDGSDEKNCFNTNARCRSGEFMCLDGSERCIRGSWRCDGEYDCKDGSDEKKCFTRDSIQQVLNISSGHIRDNESDFQIFEDLRKIIENLTDHQEDDRLRLSFGCSSDVQKALSICSERCPDVSCQLQELTNFLLSACRSGIKQTCTTPNPIDGNCDQCGIANEDTISTQNGRTPSKPSSEPTRIVGGVEVNPPRKYPWQVHLVTKGSILCAGSIINSRWILTSALCINVCTDLPSINELQIIIGDHNQFTTSDDDPVNTKNYAVRRYEIHRDLECSGVYYYNYALIELERDIPFNSVIRPVCLPEDDSKTYAGVIATVTGWGLTNISYNSYSDVLMEVEVPIVAQSECNVSASDSVEDTILCTRPMPDKGACYDDAGAPLVVKEGNKYIQVGVLTGVSCHPLLYAYNEYYGRVSKVLEWIKETTANGKCSIY